MHDKWLIGVLIFVACGYIFGTYTFDNDLPLFVQLTLVSALAIVASLVVNLIFYYRKKSKKFTISYIFLAVSISSYTIAEILWGYFESVGYETYPSVAEIFYVLYFVGAILFCVKIFWNNNCLMPKYIPLAGIGSAVACMVVYLLLSLYHVESEVFWVSTGMMILSSTLVGAGVTTTLFLLKSKDLKKIWIVIGMAFIANSIADIFYYTGENAGHYQYTDPVNIVWFSTILLLFWGLYNHRYLYTRV